MSIGECQHRLALPQRKAQIWRDLVGASFRHRRHQQRSQRVQTHPPWVPADIHRRPERRRPGGTGLVSRSSIGDSNNGPNRHMPIHHCGRAPTYIHDRKDADLEEPGCCLLPAWDKITTASTSTDPSVGGARQHTTGPNPVQPRRRFPYGYRQQPRFHRAQTYHSHRYIDETPHTMYYTRALTS